MHRRVPGTPNLDFCPALPERLAGDGDDYVSKPTTRSGRKVEIANHSFYSNKRVKETRSQPERRPPDAQQQRARKPGPHRESSNQPRRQRPACFRINEVSPKEAQAGDRAAPNGPARLLELNPGISDKAETTRPPMMKPPRATYLIRRFHLCRAYWFTGEATCTLQLTQAFVRRLSSTLANQ
jgi:hypothetical protein